MKRLKDGLSILMSFALILTMVQIPIEAESKTLPEGRIAIDSLIASSEYSGTKISNANDGNYATIWESDWQGSNFTPSETNPIVVTASFNEMKEVGQLRIVQRKGNNLNIGEPHGRFIKVRYTKLGENNEVIGTPMTETYETVNGIPKDNDIYVSINDTVKAVKIEILKAYNTTASMAELEFFEPDFDNGIAAIEANTAQSANGNGIEKAIDYDPNTIWHSAWSGFTVSETNPAVVTITRSNQNPMLNLVYQTRPAGNIDGDWNGNILKMNVYVSNDKQTWEKVNDVEWDSNFGTKNVNLGGTTDKYVKLEILEGVRGYASAAEFRITYASRVDDIDTTLIDTVKELGLSENDFKGWEQESARALWNALNNALEVYETKDVAALVQAMGELQKAYDALVVDKKPLIDKIAEARLVDCVGKNPNAVAILKRAILNAEDALQTVETPLDVAFEVTQLSEAMLLSDEAIKDIQDLTQMEDLQRNNNFNEGWLFRETGLDSQAIELDETQFESVTLPHDFSIDNDFTTAGEPESAFLLGGTGWYRKHIVLPQNLSEKSFHLVFDGAYMDTTVYVNGQRVGENHNGYNQFAFDLTDYLVCDGKTDNVIAVKVVNEIPSSRWYSGSGIYRDVTLQVTNATHIDYLGMFVATPEVSKTNAQVKVTNTIVSRTKDTKIKTVLYDRNNHVVADSGIVVADHDEMVQTFHIDTPELWSVNTDSPALYQAITTVYNGDEVVDQVEETFGLKYVEYDREEGFFLNGENMKLKGVCMHHDQGALGAAANYHAIYRQMRIMKDMGVNAIRVTHNPASEALLRACDELGLLVINEAFDHFYYAKNNNVNDFARWFKIAIGENGPAGSTPTMTWAEYVAKQMVKTGRNHASTLMYSVGNELMEGSGGDEGYIQTTADVCRWFKEEDPYHKPTIGDNWAKGNHAIALAMCEEIHKAGGIVGYNYANQTQYDAARTAHPDWIMYGSETSSAIHSRGVYNDFVRDDNLKLCSEYENEQTRVGWGHSASTAWKYVEENDWNLGTFVWTGFDYLGEPTPWNAIGTGSVSGKGAIPRSSFFGIVETTGFAKDIYYLYQSLWNENVNTLHMTKNWNDKLAKTGNKVKVQVFSDAHQIKLYLNEKEIGSMTSTVKENGQRKFNDKYYAEFDVTYEPGTLSVKAFDENGKEITDTQGIHSVTTSTKATHTSLSANKTTLECDGYDLSYVTVDLLDKDGNLAVDNNQKLIFTLEGEGNIVGVDNGNQSDAQSFRIDDPKRASRNAFNGKALVIIQSTKRAGTMKLHVKGAGLEESEITLNSTSSSTDTTLTALEFVSKYTTLINQEVELPETVTGILANGTTKELAVTWDYSTLDLTQAKTYTVKGTIEGYEDVFATASIRVYEEFAAAANYSTLMHEGSTIVLPETRNVYYANGELAGEFAVVWEYYDTKTYTSGNTYTVNGTILIAGVRLPIIAKIRVLDPLPEARNLARLTGDMPKLAQSCIKTADNLNAINNGVKVSVAPSERWTDWNQQDVQNPWVSYTWNNAYTISDVIAYIYQDHASVIPRELELQLETLDENGAWVKQEISYITPVAYNVGDGKTTINLKKPVKTNGIRFTMIKPAVDTFTGLTELEVFEYIEKETPKDNSMLNAIQLGDYEVETFTPETTYYELQVEKLPSFDTMNVTAEVDETATYVVLKDEESHRVKVIVRAENGSETTYTFNFIKKASTIKEHLQKLYEEALLLKEEMYTRDSWNTLKDAKLHASEMLDNEEALQEDIDEAERILNSAIQNLERVYTVKINGETAATGTYNTKVNIKAPVVEGKTFTGWLWKDKIVSTNETYTFFLSQDMELTPCYEEVEVTAQALVTNAFLVKRTDDKADARFVAQLIVPVGYTIKNAGLVWSSKEDTVLDLEHAKPTYITRISNTNQFSVTIKGMPKGKSIHGRIFVTLIDNEGNETVVYSETETLYN